MPKIPKDIPAGNPAASHRGIHVRKGIHSSHEPDSTNPCGESTLPSRPMQMPHENEEAKSQDHCKSQIREKKKEEKKIKKYLSSLLIISSV